MKELRTKFANFEIQIFVEDSDFANIIGNLLSAEVGNKETVVLQVIMSGDWKRGYVLSSHDTQTLECVTREDALSMLLYLIGGYICRTIKPNEMILHSAGVRMGSKAVLLSGVSGSGKTTCSLELSRYGAYLGDEYGYIDVTNGTTWYDHYPAHLKEKNPYLDRFEGYDLYKTFDKHTGRTGFYLPGETLASKKRIISMPLEPWPIAAIVFPHYSPSTERTEINPVIINKMPEYILSGLIGPAEMEPSQLLRRFIHMIAAQNISMLEVNYSDLEEAVKLLYEYLQQRRIV